MRTSGNTTTIVGDAPPALPGSQYQLQLKRGWNMVSTPIAGTLQFNQLTSNCNYEGGPWLVRNGQSYENSNAINSLEGYWIKVTNDCTTTAAGDAASMSGWGPTLRVGWNIVGIPEARAVNDVKGTCIFARGPYWYNPATNNYETLANMEPGKGYLIGVRSQCNLGISIL